MASISLSVIELRGGDALDEMELDERRECGKKGFGLLLQKCQDGTGTQEELMCLARCYSNGNVTEPKLEQAAYWKERAAARAAQDMRAIRIE